MQAKVNLDFIAPLKLLFIFGVVLIHCDIAGDGAPYANFGTEFSAFVSGGLCSACVPGFFIISGYLFFLGVDRFTPAIYCRKLRRRFSTLLIPYLLWNALCCALLALKVKLLGFYGLGIFSADGSIDWMRFTEGFWMIADADNFPYAFAFWFIRNLICIVILSPLLYFVARSRVLTILLIIVVVATNYPLWGAEYFIVGACIALHSFDLRCCRLSGWRLGVMVAVYILSALALHYRILLPVYLLIKNIVVFSGFIVVINAALRLTRIDSNRPGSVVIGATFFIYAFHQCFCRMVRKFWLAVVGDGSTISALTTYSLCFATMVAASVAVWLILRRRTPRLLAILTGNRS